MKDDAHHLTVEELVERYGEHWMRYRRSIKEHLLEEANDHALHRLQESMAPAEVTLRPWQVTCMEMLEAQSPRAILFVVDPVGNNGKTWLAKYIRANLESIYISTTSMSDVFFAYANQSVVMFDLTRQLQETINYGTLESLKNGIAFSRKYECRERLFDPAKVVVFMNQPPNMTALSADRYQVLEI